MEDCDIEEQERDYTQAEWEEYLRPGHGSAKCEICPVCVICDHTACTCVCEEMPEIPDVDDMRDEYDEAAGI